MDIDIYAVYNQKPTYSNSSWEEKCMYLAGGEEGYYHITFGKKIRQTSKEQKNAKNKIYSFSNSFFSERVLP